MDGDSHHVRAAGVVVAPHLLEQRRRWHDRARVRHQAVQQPKFSYGQAHLLARFRYRMLGHVEGDAADLEARLGHPFDRPLLAAAPQLSTNTCNKLTVAERFREIVVGAQLKATHLVLFRVERREHDHRQRRAAAQLLEHVQTARRAQIDVQDDEVRMALLKDANGRARVVRRDRLQTCPLQRKRQQVDQLAIVVNQQDPHCANSVLLTCSMQGEPDARAVAGCAVDANAAAMRFDDAFGDREPQSDPGRVTVCPHAVETLEQTYLLLGCDPWPLILNANTHHSTERTGHDTYYGLIWAVFRRIRQEIREHLARIPLIGHYRRRVLGYVNLDALATHIDRRLDDLQGVGYAVAQSHFARGDHKMAGLDAAGAEQI